MVAIVSGNGFGLSNGSAGVLGKQGQFGNAEFGTTKEGTYLNVFNGNLTLRDTDGFLANTGINLAYTRTYNSQGNFASGRGNGWTDGLARLTGAPKSGASTVAVATLVPFTRTAGDGSVSTFTYDSARGAYVSTDGGGAYQTIRWSSTDAKWHWTDGRDDDKELYEAYDTDGRLAAAGDAVGVRLKYTYDTAGRLATITSGTDVTTYAYGPLNQTTRLRTTTVTQSLAEGSTIRTLYENDERDRLVRVVHDLTPGNATDALTYAVSYTYDGLSNRIASVTQADGSTMTIAYVDEKVSSITEHDNSSMPDRVTTFTYASTSDTAVTTVTDKLGNATTYTADAQGRLIAVQGSDAALTLKFSYTKDNGDVQSVTDATGRTTWFEYDTHGNCILQRDADGNTITRTFRLLDPANPAKGYTNELLAETTYTVRDPDGAGSGKASQPLTSRNVYFTTTGMTHLVRYSITPQGRVTEYAYNAAGERTNEWTFLGKAYDTAALRPDATLTQSEVYYWAYINSSTIGPVRRVDYTYLRGQVTAATHYASAPDNTTTALSGGVTVLYNYDNAGNLLQSIDAKRKAVTTFTYDGLGRVATRTDPDGKTTYTYTGNTVTTSTDAPDGLTTLRVHDSAGRLVALTQTMKSGMSSTTRNVYDAGGRLRMTEEPGNRRTVWLYDHDGRKTAQIGPDGALTEYVYTGASGTQPARIVQYATTIDVGLLFDNGTVRDDLTVANIRPATTAFDRSSWQRYDSQGRVTASVDPEGYLTRYDYDGAGRLVATIRRAEPVPASKLVIGINWDAADDKLSADDRTTRILYDDDGLVTGKIDALGYLTEYVYDAGGRRTDTIVYATRALTPAVISRVADVRPAASANDIRERAFYDGHDRVIATVDADGYLTEMEYDENGNLVARTRHPGPSTTPAAAQLQQVRSALANSSGNTVVTRYVYGMLNRLTSETTGGLYGAATGDSIAYEYDKRGNVTKIIRTAGTTKQYSFDALGRMTAEWLDPAGVEKTRYAYDQRGQRSSTTDPNDNKTLYFYDAAGHLTHTVNALGEVRETGYDAFGAVISERTYGTRIKLDKLVEGSRATLTALLQPAVTDPRTVYYYDRDGRLIYTADTTGAVLGKQYGAYGEVLASVRYSTGSTQLPGQAAEPESIVSDIVKGRVTAGQTTRYSYDANGRLRYTINAEGEAQSVTYDTFGRALTKTGHARRSAEAPVASTDDSVQSYRYDKRGNVVSYTDAEGVTVTTTYDAASRVATRTVAGSFIQGNTSADGVLASSIAAVTAVDRTYYNDDGRVSATVDAGRALTTYAYDGDGNLIRKVQYANVLPITGPAQEALLRATASSIAIYFTPSSNDVETRYFYDNQGRQIYSAVRAGTAYVWQVAARTYDPYGNVLESRKFRYSVIDSKDNLTEARIRMMFSPAPTDAVQRFFYDGAGRLAATLTRTTSSAAKETWSVTRLQYDTRGNVTAKSTLATPLTGSNPTDADIATATISPTDALERYSYDAAGRMTRAATAQGRTTALVDGVATELTQWAITSYDYDAQGNRASRRDYDTIVTTRTAVPTDSPFDTVFAGGARTMDYYYDKANRLVRTVDSMNAVVTLEYDTRGNVIRQTAYATPTDYMGGVPQASAADRVTRTVYDRNSRPVYQIDALGAVTERRYDGVGNVDTVIRYAVPLKLSGLPAAPTPADIKSALRTDPADRTERHVYDQEGRVRFTLDAAGYLTERQYDGLGRLIVTLQYQTLVTPGTGLLAETLLQVASVQMRDTRLPPRRTETAYDAAGNVVSVKDAANNVESWQYDGVGRKTAFISKMGSAYRWTYEYDAAGHLLREISPPVSAYLDPARPDASTMLSLTTEMTYDALGNLVSRTEAAGTSQARTTKYRYDAAGRQIATIRENVSVYQETGDNLLLESHARNEVVKENPTVTVTYDAFGNAISNKDVGGNLSYKVYDRMGQVRYEIDALGQVTGYERDVFGQVRGLTRYATPLASYGAALADPATRTETKIRELIRPSADDRTIRTTYTVLGQTATVTEPETTVFDATAGTAQRAARTTETTYDPFGAVRSVSVYGTANGAAVTARTRTTWYYDVRGAKTAEVQAVEPGKGYITTYGYDAAGNLTSQYEYASAIAAWDDTRYDIPVKKAGADRDTKYYYNAMNWRTMEMRYGTFLASGVSQTAGTGFGYDKVGNLTGVYDDQGISTFTYYDMLGRTQGTVRTQGSTNPDSLQAATAQFVELRRDLLGNVLHRIEHGSGVASAVEGTMPVPQTSPYAPPDRITSTTYDSAGRATSEVDANGKRTERSYDVFGRLVKEWRTVTNNNDPKHLITETAFQLSRYDALGQLASVTRPANTNLIADSAVKFVTQRNSYNAFGEMTAVLQSDGADPAAATVRQVSYSRYDNAGRRWLSNADGGVDVITLYDAFGNASASIRNATTDLQRFRNLNSAAGAERFDNVQRVDTRYDLMGRKLDVRQQIDPTIYELTLDPATGQWNRTARGSTPAPNSLIMVGTVADALDSTITVRHRLKGSTTWVDDSATRLRKAGDYMGFSTFGLAGGQYEYEVLVQPANGTVFEREHGTLDVQSVPSATVNNLLASVYLTVFNRGPDIAGMNFYVGLYNRGMPLETVLADMFTSDEFIRRYGANASGTEVVRRVLQDAFGRTDPGTNTAADPTYAETVRQQGLLYDAGKTKTPSQLGNFIVGLVNKVRDYKGADGAQLRARDRLANRTQATLAYALEYRGNNEATRTEIMLAADTSLAAALELARAKGTDELRRGQIAQIYLMLLGRAPEKGGMDSGLKALANSGSPIELYAADVLNSKEAQWQEGFPAQGLITSQYRLQLVRHAFERALGRSATPDEEADWLAKLNGTGGKPPLGYGQFVVQLADAIASYTGTDPQALADKTLFNQRTAVALEYARIDFAREPAFAGLTQEDINRISLAAMAAVKPAKSVAEALKAAVASANATAAAMSAVKAAAAAAAVATPLADNRVQLTRLYVALFNRAPDTQGMEFYLKGLETPDRSAPPASQWIARITELLRPGTEADTAGVGAAATNRQFIERLYQHALGSVPTSAGARAEIDGFVARLATESRATVALAVVNGMLGFTGLSAAEQYQKTLYDDKVAVGMVCALTLGTDEWDIADNMGAAVLAAVATRGMGAALSDAYAYTQKRTLGQSATAIAGAKAAIKAAEATAAAAAAAAQAKAEADAAAAAASVSGQAALRLQVMQLYVGLLGRTAQQYQSAPDVAGFEYQVHAAGGHTLAAVADGMIADTEGAPLRALGNSAFVARIFANLVGVTTPVAREVAAWTALLDSGSMTRGAVTVGIIDEVHAFADATPDGSAQAYMMGRTNFDQRIADAFTALNASEQLALAEAAKPIQPIVDLGNTLPGLLQKQNAALAAQRAAQNAYTAALNIANTAGDGSAVRRLQLTRLYVTLLQRSTALPPDLTGLNWHLASTGDMPTIAQALINSDEAKGVFPADDRAFVAKLYQLILGRPAAQSEITQWASTLASYPDKAMARGHLAVDILDNWVNYSEGEPTSVERKTAFDARVTDFLKTSQAEAAAAATAAAAALSKANTALKSAQDDYDAALRTATTARSAADTAASKAVAGQRMITYQAYQSDLTYAYLSLRGYTDFDGLAFNMWALSRSATMESILEKLVNEAGYPKDATGFVKRLYTQVLGRAGTESEWAWWIDKLNGGASRGLIAKDFIKAGEAKDRYTSAVSTQMRSDVAWANSLISASAVADRDAGNAENAAAALKDRRTLAENDQLAASGTAASTSGIARAYEALVKADTLLRPANSTYLAWAVARDNYASAQAKYDDLVSKQPAEVAAYTAARTAVAENAPAIALARATAKLSARLQDIATRYLADSGGSATQRNAELVASMYVTLTNRAPLLAELRFWMERMEGGVSPADVARDIMASSVNSNLYPTGLSDAAFVDQLYRYSLGRTLDGDPGPAWWAAHLAGPNAIDRATLVAHWVESLVTGSNTDTPLFLGKVTSALRTVLAESEQPRTMDFDPALMVAEQNLKDTALAYDAAARAALAATPMGNTIVPLLRLYLALFNRTPDAAGLAFWSRTLAANSLAVVARDLLADAEGKQAFGPSLSNRDFIATLMKNLTGHPATAGELDAYMARIGTASRPDIAIWIANVMTDEVSSDLTRIANRYLVNTRLAAALDGLPAKLAASERDHTATVALLNRLAGANPTDDHAGAVVLGIDAIITQGARVDARRDVYQYDRWGNVINMLDARDPNWSTSYTYNANNQLLTQTMVTLAGRTPVYAQTNTYDRGGNLATSTNANNADANGTTTTYKYNSAGVLVEETHARGAEIGSKVTYTVNTFGDRLTSRQFANANSSALTNYTYDNMGRVKTRLTTASVGYWAWSSTPTTEVKSVSASLRDSYTYDELGRRIKTVSGEYESGTPVNPDQRTETLVRYDLSGNVISVTDAAGAVTQSAYDSQNRKIDEQTASQTDNRKHWEIDEQGRIAWHTDLGGNKTTYTYNGAGQLVLSLTDAAQRQYDGSYALEHQAIRYTYENGTGQLSKIDDGTLSQLTTYNYDRAGNRITEKVWLAYATGARAVQDHVTRYDQQGRLLRVVSRVPNAGYDISYTYDNNGNRKNVVTKFVNDANESKTVTVSYDYDLMNRQTKVSGNTFTEGIRYPSSTPRTDLNGPEPAGFSRNEAIVTHTIAYNWMGNRISDVAVNGAVTTSEYYYYDTLGRLDSIFNGPAGTGTSIGSRVYDSAGRVIKSVDNNKEVRYYDYDKMGRVEHQRLTGIDGKQINSITYGYDKVGNNTWYTVNGANNQASQTVVNTYGQLRETRLLTGTTISNVGTSQSKSSTMLYDVNGNMKNVIDDGKWRVLINDSNGQVLEKREDNLVTHSLIVNGETLGRSNAKSESFSTVYASIGSTENTEAPSIYTVQSGDTMPRIAKSIWGDERLWYLIADANVGIGDNETVLTAGLPLTIPARVNTIYNGANTFKPYSASEAIGNTTPELALPTPKANGKGGCGGLGQLVMVVVTVVATIYTAGAATGALSSFSATMSAGVSAMGTSIGAAAIGGAVGSIASQAVGIAIGAQDSFSWKSVALSAIGAGVSAGVAGPVGQSMPMAMGRAALGNVISQGIGVVTGLQDHFDWRNVAASAAGAAASNYLTGSKAFTDTFGMNTLQSNTLTGIASGTAASIVRGGKIDMVRIATDAFGNALGSSLVNRSVANDIEQKLQQLGEDLKTAPRYAYLSNRPDLNVPANVDNATLLGASRFVEGLPQVDVVGKRERSWFYENIAQPVENAFSTAGNVAAGVAQGLGDWLNDTLVRPSGSTDEIPQRWNYWQPSPYVRSDNYGYGSIKYVSSQTGQMLVPINPAMEAQQAANAARVGTTVGIFAGGAALTGFAAGAQLLDAPNDVVNNIGVAQAGVVGSVAGGPASQPIYTGPKSFPRQFGIRYESPTFAETVLAPPKPRVDISEEFVLKPSKGGGVFLRYGSPETHGLEVFVDKHGVLGFDIRSTPGGTSSSKASGTDMFSSAMLRLKSENIEVKAIRGTWIEGTDSVNTAQYIENLRTMTPREAAANTWTGKLAARYGYTNVSDPKSSFGNTTVIFGR